jgi:3-methyladenine DNA glycosylase AlkD
MFKTTPNKADLPNFMTWSELCERAILRDDLRDTKQIIKKDHAIKIFKNVSRKKNYVFRCYLRVYNIGDAFHAFLINDSWEISFIHKNEVVLDYISLDEFEKIIRDENICFVE